MYRVCGSVGCVCIECQSCHLPIAPVLVACRSEDQAKRGMLEQRHRLVDAIIDEDKCTDSQKSISQSNCQHVLHSLRMNLNVT